MAGPFGGETAGQRAGMGSVEGMFHGLIFETRCFVQTEGSADNGWSEDRLGQWRSIRCFRPGGCAPAKPTDSQSGYIASRVGGSIGAEILPADGTEGSP